MSDSLITFDVTPTTIVEFLPPIMRREDVALLQKRECPVCPPSRSIKCTHYDGLYVVHHTTIDAEGGLRYFVCAGYNEHMKSTYTRDGQHEIDLLNEITELSIETADELYERRVRELLAGTLFELLPRAFNNRGYMPDSMRGIPATLILPTDD